MQGEDGVASFKICSLVRYPPAVNGDVSKEKILFVSHRLEFVRLFMRYIRSYTRLIREIKQAQIRFNLVIGLKVIKVIKYKLFPE